MLNLPRYTPPVFYMGGVLLIFQSVLICTLHMPITKSAKKALRVSDRKRVVNIRRKKTVEVAVKSVKKLVVSGEKKAVAGAMSLAYKALDKAAKNGLIKKGAASRKKSRLAALAKKIA